jgi:flagellar basal body P-ring formation protein FlgA
MSLRSVICASLLISASALAAPRQEANAILAVVKNFVLHANAGARGTVEMEVNAVDLRVSLPDCAELQAFRPDGASAAGDTSVGVRCLGASSWSIVLPVRILVTGYYLAAAHPIERGQLLQREDFVTREGDLTQLPADALNTALDAVGKVTTIRIASGDVIQSAMMRAPASQPMTLAIRGRALVASNSQSLAISDTSLARAQVVTNINY